MPPPPLDSKYTRYLEKTDNYTLTQTDDVVNFTIATAKTATLPLAKICTIYNEQYRKVISNDADSSDTLTIAVASGNSLVGNATLAAGEVSVVTSDGATVWYAQGDTGLSGVSGFSGFSGASGFSGWSGFSGASGTSGYSGVSGRSGYTGVSGYSGYTGVSGYSGFSGISGYSGFSGYSGYSGYSGV